jgi:hypothetical protein
MSMATMNTLITATRTSTIQNLYIVKCEWQRERANDTLKYIEFRLL